MASTAWSLVGWRGGRVDHGLLGTVLGRVKGRQRGFPRLHLGERRRMLRRTSGFFIGRVLLLPQPRKEARLLLPARAKI